jgi:hypothetical protein
MNPIRHLRRLAAALAGLATALLATATPAFAVPPPPEPPGWNKHPPLPSQVHTVVIGGMPGWQIALIAAGTALLAATVAVLAYRAWTARRKTITAAALTMYAGNAMLHRPRARPGAAPQQANWNPSRPQMTGAPPCHDSWTSTST